MPSLIAKRTTAMLSDPSGGASALKRPLEQPTNSAEVGSAVAAAEGGQGEAREAVRSPKKARLGDDLPPTTTTAPPDSPNAESSGSNESSSKRERLLFLLQVASDPRVTGSLFGNGEQEGAGAEDGTTSSLSSNDNEGVTTTPSSSAPSAAAVPSPPPPEVIADQQPKDDDASSATNGSSDDDEAAKKAKQRRIQFALSVLNSPTAENEARLKKAVAADEEEKQKKKELRRKIQEQHKKLKLQGQQIKPGQQPNQRRFVPRPPGPPMRKRTNARKRTFPEKLMDVLSKSDTEAERSIMWLPNGNSFVIVSPKLFTGEILPRYFKSAKFESFTRKLNRWGYKRITKGTNAVAYSHELFRRDRPDLTRQMKGDGRGSKDGGTNNNEEGTEGGEGGGGGGKPGSAIANLPDNIVPPPPLPLQTELEEELRRELEAQRRAQRRSELRPRVVESDMVTGTTKKVMEEKEMAASAETNGAREAASALERLSASYNKKQQTLKPKILGVEQQQQPLKPKILGVEQQQQPLKTNQQAILLPKPRTAAAVDYTLSATLKDSSPSVTLANMLSRLDQHRAAMQLANPTSSGGGGADGSGNNHHNNANAAMSNVTAHSRAKLQSALRGHHHHHHHGLSHLLSGGMGHSGNLAALGAGAGGLPFKAGGAAGAAAAAAAAGGGAGATSLTASPALAMYYNRKMHQITARYSGQMSAAAVAASASQQQQQQQSSRPAPVQEERPRSYLHRIRQNLAEQNGAASAAGGAPSAPPALPPAARAAAEGSARFPASA